MSQDLKSWDPKPGDVVVLKSGGPPMTVIGVPDGDEPVVVLWMNPNGLDTVRTAIPKIALRPQGPRPQPSYRQQVGYPPLPQPFRSEAEAPPG